MGNILASLFVVIILGSIIYKLQKDLRIKGHTCTSCTACPIVKTCEKDNLIEEIKTQISTN